MKKLFSSTKAYLLLAGVAALMASCQDYEPANEQMTKEAAYNYEFERQFGPVDPNHDWSMATRVTANIDLSDAPEGTYEVKIFSEKNGYLLTKAIVENSAQISFDAIKGENSVRILARKTSALGLSVINGYFPIVDGEVNTAKDGTRAKSEEPACNTSVGDQIDLGTKVKQGVAVEVYQAQNGTVNDGGNDFKATLPTDDNIYYYTKIDGQTYEDGDNGNYSVTYNGETSTMNMHAIAEYIEGGSARYYEQTDAVYQYHEADGDHYGNYVTELPSDGKYYITPIDGESYGDGDDGKYSVTLNGTTSQMTMHELSPIIASGNFLMYKTETRTIYSDDQTNWKEEYNSSPDKQTEYSYVAQAGSFGEDNGNQVDALPNDGKYYITKIAGEDYSDGSNGKYSVYYNGTTSQMDMYEVADIISNCTPYTLLESGKYSITYWGSPAYYKVNRYYLSVDGYNLAGGQYVTPAYYEMTQDAGYTIAPAVVHAPYYQTQSQNITVKWAGDFYYLNNVYKTIDEGTQVKFDDLLPLVSSSHPDPIFHEQVDNRTKYEDVLDFNVELVLTEDGPMTYTYVFYGSIYHNMLGYFYWNETDDMTPEQIKQARINAPRYVLMDDTFPTEVQSETGKPNLQCYNDQDGTNAHTPGGMDMPTWVEGDYHLGHYMQGTTYHMVYFGENGPTYTFPEGLHVAFFLLTKATSGGSYENNKGTGLFYSIQDMNEDQEIIEDAQGTKYILNDKHWWAAEASQGSGYNPSEERFDEGEVAAVFYSYKGNMVLGFEDDVDKDENDMLFLISAPVEPPVELTTEEENTWIVACEDLGGTYDYDFNDLVFEVTLHTTTTETSTSGGSSAGSSVSFSSEVLFRPLAAGGTLPAKVYLGETEIGEIHALLGGSGTSTSTPINVGPKGSSVSLSGLDPTPVNTGETYYTSIASVLEDIKIVVTNEGNKDATEITAPNQDKTSNIPQMLLLPKGWDWPTEQTHIYNVYPEFENWATDMTKNGWIEDPSTNSINTSYYMVNPFK